MKAHNVFVCLCVDSCWPEESINYFGCSIEKNHREWHKKVNIPIVKDTDTRDSRRHHCRGNRIDHEVHTLLLLYCECVYKIYDWFWVEIKIIKDSHKDGVLGRLNIHVIYFMITIIVLLPNYIACTLKYICLSLLLCHPLLSFTPFATPLSQPPSHTRRLFIIF